MYVVRDILTILTAGIPTTMLDLVTRMKSTVCAVIVGLKQTFKALCVVTEVVIAVVERKKVKVQR